MATCNPFKVGDKVKIKEDPYGIFSRAGFRLNIIYTVKEVEFDRLYLKETVGCIHYTHFELYKEEKDMTPQTTQQTQQKTKRVPFTHELWGKWKDKGGKVVYTLTGKYVLQFAYFPEADHRYRCVYLTCPGTLVRAGDIDELELEIPVTTKRIPFNPELKDAKVFIESEMFNFNVEIREWYFFSNNFVALLDYEDNIRIKHRGRIEMETEENV